MYRRYWNLGGRPGSLESLEGCEVLWNWSDHSPEKPRSLVELATGRFEEAEAVLEGVLSMADHRGKKCWRRGSLCCLGARCR